MSQKRHYRIAAISSATIGAGALAGFVMACLVVRVLSFHGEREAPAAGIFLIALWAVFIPLGALLGSVIAFLRFKRRSSSN
jgi:hypothetical protein